MLTGLNHLTLAVTDVDRSVAFYSQVMGFRPRAQWHAGAYLSLGELWLCVSLDAARTAATAADYTHSAFTVDAASFPAFVAHALQAGMQVWQANRSEGESFYFLDPDGHKLAVHVGDLASRLRQCRAAPYAGMRFFDV